MGTIESTIKINSRKLTELEKCLTCGFIHLCILNQMNEVIEKKYKQTDYCRLKKD